MRDRPSTLAPDREAAFESYAESVRQRALDAVESLLLELEPALAQAVYDLAFSANDALPRRTQRPDTHVAVLADAAADAVDLGEDDREALLAFTVAIQEYYDVLDDLVDGDVDASREAEVQVVAQALLPLAVGRLGALGSDAVEYWSRAATALVAAPHVEARTTPSADGYLELLDRQSHLFGFVTGVAAAAAGREEADVDWAAELGRTVYRFEQLLRDYRQLRDGDDDPWNGATLLGEDALFETLEDQREAVRRLTEAYEEPSRRRLRALVAVDLVAVRTDDSRA